MTQPEENYDRSSIWELVVVFLPQVICHVNSNSCFKSRYRAGFIAREPDSLVCRLIDGRGEATGFPGLDLEPPNGKLQRLLISHPHLHYKMVWPLPTE